MIQLVLLDRDGVLNREIGGYITNTEEFEVLPHVVPNLQKLKEAGCRFVIITNQSGIAKRKYTHDMLEQIHQKLRTHLLAHHIELDEIYYCPHDPYLSLCTCRKPKSGMIEKALARFNVSPEHAIMIGDTPRDIEAAEKVGVRGYKIDSNRNWKPIVDEIVAINSQKH